MTSALWQERTLRVLTENRQEARLGVVLGPDEEVTGDLAVDASRLDGHGMAKASGVAEGHGWWRLIPREGGNEATALLANPSLFSIESAELMVNRQAVGDEIQRSDAELRLTGLPCLAGLAVVLDGANLPVETLRALQQVAVGDAFPALREREPMPAMLAECTERLVRLDLSPLGKAEGRLRPVRLQSYAWVDEALCPVNSPRARELLGEDFATARTTLRERLEGVSRLRLLVVLAVGDAGLERVTLSLRPDAVWLWGAMQSSGAGHVVHDSHWLAEPQASALTMVSESLAARVRGSMWVHFVESRYVIERENVFVKILLTPLALAVDTCTLGVCAYLQSLFQDDDDCESSHRHHHRH